MVYDLFIDRLIFFVTMLLRAQLFLWLELPSLDLIRLAKNKACWFVKYLLVRSSCRYDWQWCHSKGDYSCNKLFVTKFTLVWKFLVVRKWRRRAYLNLLLPKVFLQKLLVEYMLYYICAINCVIVDNELRLCMCSNYFRWFIERDLSLFAGNWKTAWRAEATEELEEARDSGENWETEKCDWWHRHRIHGRWRWRRVWWAWAWQDDEGRCRLFLFVTFLLLLLLVSYFIN